jgi:RHS repeat-associated protein
VRDAETGLDYFGARYFSAAQGRFTTPDEFKGGIVDPFTGQDIETNTALPYADITDPQTLNKYAYVRNNPQRYIDPTGHAPSDLVYDGDTNRLTLYSDGGDQIGSWDANNNAAIHDNKGGHTNGPVVDGTYDVRASDAKGSAWGHAGETSYGAEGIAHFEGMVGATGKVMSGAGVHSGRNDNAKFVTFGCIRTTDAAMKQIKTTAKSDPLKTLTVKNNQANVTDWKKRREEDRKREAKGKPKKETENQ